MSHYDEDPVGSARPLLEGGRTRAVAPNGAWIRLKGYPIAIAALLLPPPGSATITFCPRSWCIAGGTLEALR